MSVQFVQTIHHLSVYDHYVRRWFQVTDLLWKLEEKPTVILVVFYVHQNVMKYSPEAPFI